MATATFTRLLGAQSDLETVSSVLRHAHDYAEAVHGEPFGPEEAVSVFNEAPLGVPADTKRVYVVRFAGFDAGVIEFVIGHPTPSTLMLGLLVLDERFRGIGLGKKSADWVELHALAHEGCVRVRLGVVRSNVGALAFWKAMGYIETGEVKPWHDGAVTSEVVAFEKRLVAGA